MNSEGWGSADPLPSEFKFEFEFGRGGSEVGTADIALPPPLPSDLRPPLPNSNSNLNSEGRGFVDPLPSEFKVTLDHFRITLGSLWSHFGTTLESLWDHFGTTLE